MTKKNALTAGKKLKADCAATIGDHVHAQTLYTSVCRLDPTDAEAWTKLSLVEKALGNYTQAERCARRAVTLAPKLAYGHYALGQALHGQLQGVAACASYRTAVQLMPDLADAHFLLGLALHELGDLGSAHRSLLQALKLRPTFSEALAELGAVNIDVGDVEAGLRHLHAAKALRPMNVTVLGNIAHALRLQGDNQAALDGFRHALSVDPDNADLIAGLAGMLEKKGELEEAQQLIEQGLHIAPRHVLCNLVAAQLDRRGHRLQIAIDRLRNIFSPGLPVSAGADIALELGQMLDQAGDAVHAFPMIVEGKRLKALATLGHTEAGGNSAYLTKLARVRQLASPELCATLRLQREMNAAGALTNASSPVFLIGFPRSGTTLMEQILDSHPDIQAIEEKPTTPCMVSRALDMLGSQGNHLIDLTDAQLDELREQYFAEAFRYTQLRAGQLLIDKLPLNIVDVPVISRVFPNARFIVAIRHPCDVTLSCLMQNFAPNAAMANFLALEDTVHLYAQVMSAWLHYADTLPIHFHLIRYEDLIEDIPGQSRRLLEFLGLPWNDEVLKHTDHARQRAAINTPSYHQVVQPIYQRSKYRWVRYAEQLKDVLPVLQPFIDRFGYAEPARNATDHQPQKGS